MKFRKFHRRSRVRSLIKEINNEKETNVIFGKLFWYWFSHQNRLTQDKALREGEDKS